ncbi:MAG: fibronectin type III domain-containing protein [Myxococcota bacterium]
MPRPGGILALLSLVACRPDEEIGLADSGAKAAGLCEGAIPVPRAGYDSEDAVLADAHADVFGADAVPRQVHLSWAIEPATSASFVWRTDADTLATRVELGLDSTYGDFVHGRSFLVAETEANGRLHEAHACGLEPGTTYHYRVGGDGHWSEDRTFTTAPAPGEAAPFRFAVAGDSRDAPDTWGLLLDAMEAHAPDFYVFTGDAVRLGVSMDEWDAWLDAGEGHLDRRPIVMAHGNHEFQAQAWFALFAQPGNEQWFSFDYANAHFAFLNDTVARSGDLEVQAAWLEADLAATDAPWRFAVHHKPAWSSCTAHGSNLDLRALWSPVEEAGGVALDLTGHNHNYERSVPLRDGLPATAELGTTYVVAAGAGAELYGNDLSEPNTAVASVSEHFVLVEVDGGALELNAYDLAGNLLDTFSTTR